MSGWSQRYNPSAMLPEWSIFFDISILLRMFVANSLAGIDTDQYRTLANSMYTLYNRELLVKDVSDENLCIQRC